MFKNVLVPTDGSSLSLKAATQGVALAKSLGAKVTGFFAAPPATPVVYRNNLPVGFAQPAEHEHIITKIAAKHLDAIERLAKKAGVRFEGVHITNDYAADAIMDIAKKKKCDVIVMATSGQGGVRGMFIGSVTQKVLNQSKIPVLVLR
jgi:nucleotide-binding universal stress UspA family protein